VGKGRPEYNSDNLTAICELIIYKIWELRCLTTLWVSTSCYGDIFTIFTSSFYVPMIIVGTGCISYSVLPGTLLYSAVADVGDDGKSVSPLVRYKARSLYSDG
jgi:hypothetical protein